MQTRIESLITAVDRLDKYINFWRCNMTHMYIYIYMYNCYEIESVTRLLIHIKG